MYKNNLEKMMIFSDEKIKTLIENIISDESVVENQSASALYEKHIFNSLLPLYQKHIFNSLLPSNISAQKWIQLMYDGYLEINEVISAAFRYLSSGISWQAKYKNALPLVEYASHLSTFSSAVPTGKEEELPYFLVQLDAVIGELEYYANNYTGELEGIKKSELLKEADYARELYKTAKDKPQCMKYINIYSLICNNWEYLKKHTITYRLLSAMAKMEKGWISDAETRYKLTQILKIVSDDWKD